MTQKPEVSIEYIEYSESSMAAISLGVLHRTGALGR